MMASRRSRSSSGTVIGISPASRSEPVADEHRVDLAHGDPFQQPRHDRVANIDKQPELVVFHEVAAARLAGLRPGTAAAEHRQPHPMDSTGRPSRPV
jgi:hypothetical protein